MDYAVRKATELGVAAIQPIVTARSAPMPDGERGEKRVAHWRQVAAAACEQCGRNRIPRSRRAACVRRVARGVAGNRDRARCRTRPNRSAPSRRSRRRSPSRSVPKAGSTRARAQRRSRARIHGGVARSARAADRHRGCGGDRRRPGDVGRFAMTTGTQLRGPLLVCGALLLAGGSRFGCATTPREAERAAAKSYAFVVLGEEGEPSRVLSRRRRSVPRSISTAAPSRWRCAPPGNDAVASDVQRARAVEAFRLSRADLRQGDSRTACRERRSPVAALPLPKANPRRIVVIGDTGCRIKTSDNVFQACDDSAQWPFAAVASAAAAAAPGPRHPRRRLSLPRERVPARQRRMRRQPVGLRLGRVGGRLVRAGREAAARPHRGSSCAATTNRAIARGRAGGAFSIRGRSGLRQNCDDRRRRQRRRLQRAVRGAARVGPRCGHAVHRVRFVAGRRVAALPRAIRCTSATTRSSSAHSRSPRGRRTRSSSTITRFSRSRRTRRQPNAPYPGNGALQSVLAPLDPTTLFPPSVKALLSGHVHLFEVVSYSTPQPAQFVSGNGGDWIDRPLPTRCRRA